MEATIPKMLVTLLNSFSPERSGFNIVQLLLIFVGVTKAWSLADTAGAMRGKALGSNGIWVFCPLTAAQGVQITSAAALGIQAGVEIFPRNLSKSYPPMTIYPMGYARKYRASFNNSY